MPIHLAFSFDPGTLWASMLWGAIGSGFAAYGWKQKSTLPLYGGVLIIAACYFCDSALIMTIVCLLILAAMYGLRNRDL